MKNPQEILEEVMSWLILAVCASGLIFLILTNSGCATADPVRAHFGDDLHPDQESFIREHWNGEK